jgi:cyclopropane-fatty-acyl-phospholipid synthase
MNTLASNSLPLPGHRAAAPSSAAPATRTAIKLLQNIEGGSLRLVLPDGQSLHLGHGPERATLEVSDERVFRRVLAEGDIGFGESWIDGDWHSEQPAELLTLLAENRRQLARAVHGSWLPLLGHRLRHLLRSNTRAGSKRNILAHYDLGNDFYKLWLDPSMSYSAALFGADPQQSLAQAQRQKYLRLLDRWIRNPARRSSKSVAAGAGWPKSPPPNSAAGCMASPCHPRNWHGRRRGHSARALPKWPIFRSPTTATSAAATTTSSRSRCSRRSASASGPATSRSSTAA